MGFINLSTFRLQEKFVKVDRPRQVSDAKAQIRHVDRHQEDNKGGPAKKEHPFLPRTLKDAVLPFIPPAEVAERNGDGSNRLCTYLSDRFPPLPCYSAVNALVVSG